MNAHPLPVVAAVGHRGWASVVEHAVPEALHRGADLHLLHAEGASEKDGPALLVGATGRASELSGGRMTVSATLSQRAPVAAISDLASRAGLVVLGRCRPGAHAHPYTRSVMVGVAAHAGTPVLTVPDVAPVGGVRPSVVVGVDAPERSHALIAAAAAAARDRDARLVVLSASWRPLGARSTPLTHVGDHGDLRLLEDAIWRTVREVLPDDGGLSVEVVVRRDPPGEVLLAESRTADLVVLGRHATLIPTGSHLGPVARTVLCEATCPVLLVAPGHRHHVEPTTVHRSSVEAG